jgi:hypothetical protein
MSINVTVVGSTNITAVIGNNDGVDVAIGGTLAYSPLTALQVTAGANITVTTTSGVFTIIGRDVPVQSVNGQTGSVSITLANLTAAASSHTHVMSDISDLVFPVTKVNGQTGDVSLTAADLTAALAIHTHSTTDVVGFTAAASAAAPVQSVAGRTGVISLVAADVSGLAPVATSGSYTSLSDIPTSFTPSSHTHQASEITDLTSVANVVSVNGITGTPVIVGGSGVTVSTAGSSITIEAAGVTDAGASLSDATPQPLGTAAAGVSSLASRADHVHELPTISYTSLSNVPTAFAPDTNVANVVSVNGQTGVVSLDSLGVSAASAVHSHVASDITDLTSVANVVSVNGQTGVVTINAGDALPTQDGNATRLLTTDGTNASWATRYSVVDPVVVAGAGISISRDTSAGQVTIGSQVGISGTTAALVFTQSPSADQNDYSVSGDIIRLNPSTNVTLSGLASGEDGVVKLLYNVGTHVVTLSTGNTNSAETNRFAIVSGDVELSEGDSASVWYDGTSQRWRTLEDQVAGASGGSGGGIAMAYLFGG